MIKSMLRKLILWAIKGEFNNLRSNICTAVETSVDGKLKSFLEKHSGQSAALQAVDVSFRDSGKVIVIARVGDKDVVKIIDVHPELTLNDYVSLTKEVEARFGARVEWVDGPDGHYCKPIFGGRSGGLATRPRRQV